MRCDVRSYLLHLLQAVKLGSFSLDARGRRQRTHAIAVTGFNLMSPFNTDECCRLSDISANLCIVSNTVLLLQS